MAVIDSYSEANATTNAQLGYNGVSAIVFGQSFRGDGNEVNSCKFYFRATKIKCIEI